VTIQFLKKAADCGLNVEVSRSYYLCNYTFYLNNILPTWLIFSRTDVDIV